MHQNGHFSAGAEILPANLVQLRTLARQLPLHQQKKVLNDLTGSHASAIRGRGLDYAEVREYQPGDDIRAMDWRVTARTGDAHIKVFREEKERPVLLVCDLRANMRFGSRRALNRCWQPTSRHCSPGRLLSTVTVLALCCLTMTRKRICAPKPAAGKCCTC
ncbi:MAG: DUF58 domain-containing protein [Saccharospirillaceae bacterium]|nr:DUF58 domain-containing protein [Saccharospirillaceae bacterium]